MASVEREHLVLVVDDEDDVRETLQDLFEHEGYAVATASNGEEALSLLKCAQPKPCLVVLDLIMPQMDGVALYGAMRGDPTLASIPVVISTSDPTRAPPGVPVIRKPVHIDALLDAARRAC